MKKYLILMAVFAVACEESIAPEIDQYETVTYSDEFTTSDEHDSTYGLTQGRLKITVVGAGGGAGGGSTNRGLASVSSFGSGGGGGAGEVIIIEDFELGENPTFEIKIGAAGDGGRPDNAGTNGGVTEVILNGDTANPIALAFGGSGGGEGVISNAGEAGKGFPDGEKGRNGAAGSNPQPTVGGNGGNNGTAYGTGGTGGSGEATGNGEATSGTNGIDGYVRIEITGKKLIQ